MAVSEFKDVKRIVKHHYCYLASKQVREYIITNHSTNHRNNILLGELICIKWASSTVECGFSTTNRMLVPSRKSLSKTCLNNLMLRVNAPVLKALYHQYEEKPIAKAVASYIPCKYHKTKSKASTATKLTYDSAHIVDLFLPQTQDKFVSSEYLADDILNDEDNVESDEEQVKVEERQVRLNEE